MVSKRLGFIVFSILLIGMVNAWSVSLDSPLNQNYDSKLNSITWSIDGINQSELNNCWYELNSDPAENFNCDDFYLSQNISSLEGDNTWTVYVNDTSGSIESDSVDFWVDSISPVINWIVPGTNPIAWASDTINLQISYTEVNPKSIEFEIFDALGDKKFSLFDSILPFTTSTSKSSLPDDEYMCYVTIKDTMNHVTTIETQVFIDNIDPIASINAPINGSLHRLDVDVETSATDDRSGVNRIEIEVDGNPEATCSADTCDTTVDTTLLIDGFHIVDAIAYDNAGNSDTDSITIEVDNTAPVITLNPTNPQVIEVFDSYTELGATSLDARDGDLTAGIVVDSSAVDTSVLGNYSVIYYSTDVAGNTGTETRTVSVVDTTPPVITLVGANPQEIEYGDAYVEQGATALDNYDGDLTGSIVIDSSAINLSALGSYNVTYDVLDSSGNPAITLIRTVEVVDNTPPVITLTGANPQVIEVGDAYVEQGATALDNYDGDLTGSIVTDSSAVNTAVVGEYNVTYDVSDSFGNPTTEIRTVSVVDTTAPVITLVGANPQVIERMDVYVEQGATALDNYDGDLTGSIVTDSSEVNTAVVGDYNVTYEVTDSNSNTASEIRTVQVRDTVTPSITIHAPLDNTTYTVNYVNLDVSSDEAGTWKYTLDNGVTNNTFTPNTTITGLANGAYDLTVYITDASGNENSSSVSFTIAVPAHSSSSSGGSCKTKWVCTEWSEWSACEDNSRTRSCTGWDDLAKCREGLRLDNVKKLTQAQFCVVDTPAAEEPQDLEVVAPIEEPEEEEELGIFGRLTGGVTGFARSGTGKVIIGALVALSLLMGAIHFIRQRRPAILLE